MDLHVTHHALERMGYIHLSMLHFVPTKLWATLSSPAAQKLRKLLKMMVMGMANAKRAALPARVESFKQAMYGLGDVWMYDPTQGNLYTFRPNHKPEQYGTNLITVAHMDKSKRKLLENHPDPESCPKLKDFTAICVPYFLVPKASCESLPHPHGGSLPIRFKAAEGKSHAADDHAPGNEPRPDDGRASLPG